MYNLNAILAFATLTLLCSTSPGQEQTRAGSGNSISPSTLPTPTPIPLSSEITPDGSTVSEVDCCEWERVAGACAGDVAEIRVWGAGDAPIQINGIATMPQIWTGNLRGSRHYTLTGMTPTFPNTVVIESRSEFGVPIRCEGELIGGNIYRLTLRSVDHNAPNQPQTSGATQMDQNSIAIASIDAARNQLVQSSDSLMMVASALGKASKGMTKNATEINQSASKFSSRTDQLLSSVETLDKNIRVLASMVPQTAKRIYELEAGGSLTAMLQYDDSDLVLSGIVISGAFLPQVVKLHDKNDWMIDEVASSGSLELTLHVKLTDKPVRPFPGATKHTVDVELKGEIGKRSGTVQFKTKENEKSIQTWLMESTANVKNASDDEKLFANHLIDSITITGMFKLGSAEPKKLSKPITIKILSRN